MNLDWREVCMFKAYAFIATVLLTSLIKNFTGVKMPMNVNPKPTEGLRVEWDVTQDDFVLIAVELNNVSANVIEVRYVVFQLEDVMVAFDEDKASIQAT